MGNKELSEEQLNEKYKDGRVCTICKHKLPLNNFRFKDFKKYRGHCNVCNKLISYVQVKKSKPVTELMKIYNRHIDMMDDIKKHNFHFEMSRRLKYIIMHFEKSSTDIAKIINGEINEIEN